MTELLPNQIQNLAIIGIDCCVNNCQNINELERSIYQGNQYDDSLSFDLIDLPIPEDQASLISPRQLLTLKVIKQAYQDANLPANAKVAIINISNIEVSANFIKKIFPQISFITPEKSLLSALEFTYNSLINYHYDAIIITAANFLETRNNLKENNTGVQTLSYDKNAGNHLTGEGIAAIVLQLKNTAKQTNRRVYAVIDTISTIKNINFSHLAIKKACKSAFEIANIQPEDIGYLEVFASGNNQRDTAEIAGIVSAYQHINSNLTCALGSIKANIGDTHSANGIFSLIKTALCIYHRYIPSVPQWTDAKTPEIWRESPFYVATVSKPWFIEPNGSKRIAAINHFDENGNYAHLILSEVENQQQSNSKCLQQTPFYLFAIAANDRTSLLEQITILQQTITNSSSLLLVASQNFQKYQQHQTATYTLVILGHNHNEITRELQRAVQGVNVAFDTGKDWLTPVGSYFTPKPQGKKGKIAFVYPGSFTSYIGLGKDLFRLFPQIYDDPLIKNGYNRVANIEKLIYPRSFPKLTKRQLEAIEQKLIDDPVSMLESEVGFAGFFTAILKNSFQLQPDCVFGYSLGETSMMLAQGVWTSFQESSNYLNSSPLFKTRLSGPKNTVREAWGLPIITDNQTPEFWANYILKCPLSQVQEIIKTTNRVYIPLINTLEEVVIAGEITACQKVIDILQCGAFNTSINHVIHCEPMQSEYDEFVKVNNLPVANIPETVFYSAAEYAPITIENSTIAKKIAKTLCQQLDFPRLVNTVYNDNVRIFIEVGVGGNCSRWISETLKEKEHLSLAVNRRGVDDHSSIIKALAKLISHQVNLDLSQLYIHSTPNYLHSPLLTTVTKTPLIYPETVAKSVNTSLLNFSKDHQQKLTENNKNMVRTHSLLLQSRQKSLQKMTILLQQQLDLYKEIIAQSSKVK